MLLQLAKRLVEHRSIHLLLERAADQAVAMFARERPAILEHQVGDFLGDRLELAHAVLGLEVDHRPDVQAADRGMRVDAGLRLVPRDDLQELGDVVAQVLGCDGCVLDERDRLGVSLLGHRQPQRHRAELPDASLGRGIGDGQVVISEPAAGAGRLRARRAEEARASALSPYNSIKRIAAGIALEEVAEPARLGIQPSAFEHVPVHDLDRRRVCRRISGVAARASSKSGELDDERRPGARQLDELQLGLDRQAERPLRADEQAGQVEADVARTMVVLGNELVEVVSADAPEDLGKAAIDLLGVLGGQPPRHAVTGAFQILPAHLAVELRFGRAASNGPTLPSDSTTFSSST